jgi:hypothetical protein
MSTKNTFSQICFGMEGHYRSQTVFGLASLSRSQIVFDLNGLSLCYANRLRPEQITSTVVMHKDRFRFAA